MQYKNHDREIRCIPTSNHGPIPKCKAYEELIEELHEPKEERNIKTNIYMKKIIKRFTKIFLKELHNPTKTIAMHLSSQKGVLSWDYTIAEQKK